MSARWYLVKRNWPATAARIPRYAGVGGDTWPLYAASSASRRAVHDAVFASRKYVKVAEQEEYLCTEPRLAEAYYEALRDEGGAWLLMICEADSAERGAAGYDVGHPSGGFSLLESELITRNLPGPPLNEWGLFSNVSDAKEFTSARGVDDSLEDPQGSEMLGVWVLRSDY